MTNSKRHLWRPTLALIMSVLMVVTLLPLNVFAEEPTPAIATRDASAPEESEVGNDSRDAVHAFVGVQTGGDLNLPLADATGQQFKPI